MNEIAPATDLGVIIKSSNLISYKIVHCSKRDGRDLLCWTTTAESGGYFSAMDLTTGEVISHPLNHLEAYPIVVGSDGIVYVGSTSGEVMRWDPAADTWGPLGKPLFAILGRWVNHVRVMCEGAGDWLYAGSCTGERARIHMVTGEIETLPDTPEEGNWYVDSIVRLPDDRIAFGYGHTARIFVYDPERGKDVAQWMPRGWTEDGFCDHLIVGESVLYAMHFPSGRRAAFNAFTGKFLGEVPWPRKQLTDMWSVWSHSAGHGGVYDFYLMPGTDTMFACDGKHVHTYNALQPELAETIPVDEFTPPPELDLEMRYGMTTDCHILEYDNLRLNIVNTIKPPQPDSERVLYGVGVGPEGKVNGGAYQNTLLYCCDSETGNTQVLGDHHPGWAGQTYSFAIMGDELLCASYIQGAVVAYDPTKPWDSEPGRMVNPRRIGFFGQQVYRPFGLIVAEDGRIWSVGPAGWGSTGGGIAHMDPTTGKTESVALPEWPWDVIEIPNGRLLICGEEHLRWWDCRGNRQIGEIQPPVAVVTSALVELGPPAKILMASEREIMLVSVGEPGELDVLWKIDSPIQIARILVHEGRAVVAGPDGLAMLNMATKKVTVFCDTPLSNRFGIAVTAGKVFFHNEAHLMAASLPSW